MDTRSADSFGSTARERSALEFETVFDFVIAADTWHDMLALDVCLNECFLGCVLELMHCLRALYQLALHVIVAGRYVNLTFDSFETRAAPRHFRPRVIVECRCSRFGQCLQVFEYTDVSQTH